MKPIPILISGILYILAGPAMAQWTRVDGIPAGESYAVISFASFSQQGTAFLAATTYRSMMHAIGSQGLHRTTDGGTTWTEFDPGAGFLATGGLAQTPDELYAFLGKPGATYLLKLSDDDSSWTQVDIAPGATFAMAASGNSLFGGKIDGLWKYDLTPSSVDGDPPVVLPGNLVLEQNYPSVWFAGREPNDGPPEIERGCLRSHEAAPHYLWAV